MRPRKQGLSRSYCKSQSVNSAPGAKQRSDEGTLKDHRVLSSTQRVVDEVVLPELRPRGLADSARDCLQHVEHAAVVRKNWRCAFRSGLSPNNQALDGTFPGEYS